MTTDPTTDRTQEEQPVFEVDQQQSATPTAPAEPAMRWVARLWLVVAVFALVAVVRSVQVDIGFKDPNGSVFANRFGLSLTLLVVIGALDAARRSYRAGRGLRGTPAAVTEAWTGRRLGLVLVALGAYHVVYWTYHNLKSWDVLNAPRDEMLLRWDRWLFFGHSPAVLLHDLLGEVVATYVLVYIYESFGTMVVVSFVAALVLQPRIRQGYVYIASACWVWILGTASYYMIPSLGPFDSAPEEFAGLPHTTIQETQARYMAQRAHLLADPQAPDAYAQVSAFASLHVGVTTLMLLMARYYGLRWTSRFLTAFLIGTMIATVHLGWHFFVDVPAGLLIGWLGVLLGRWVVYPRWTASGREQERHDRQPVTAA